jgi:hypothetical protein
MAGPMEALRTRHFEEELCVVLGGNAYKLLSLTLLVSNLLTLTWTLAQE